MAGKAVLGIENGLFAYGAEPIFENVSFMLDDSRTGLVGDNGAGKSSLLKCLVGEAELTKGQIVRSNSLHFAYLAQDIPSELQTMTVREVLARSLARVHSEDEWKIDVLLDELNIAYEDGERQFGSFSGGWQRLVLIAAATSLEEPDVLILDEPTDGLDPNQKHEVRALIKRMGESKAIIFSTHILEEVEAACSRAIIIDRGKVVADGTPDELKQRGLQAVRLSVKDVAGAAVREQIEKIGGIHQMDSVHSKENSFTARLLVAKGRKPAEIAREVSALAATHRWTLEELHQEEGRLDEVFRSITRSDTTA